MAQKKVLQPELEVTETDLFDNEPVKKHEWEYLEIQDICLHPSNDSIVYVTGVSGVIEVRLANDDTLSTTLPWGRSDSCITVLVDSYVVSLFLTFAPEFFFYTDSTTPVPGFDFYY